MTEWCYGWGPVADKDDTSGLDAMPMSEFGFFFDEAVGGVRKQVNSEGQQDVDGYEQNGVGHRFPQSEDLTNRYRCQSQPSCQSRRRRTYQEGTLDMTRDAAVPLANSASTGGAPGTTSDTRTGRANVAETTRPPMATWITLASVAARREGVGRVESLRPAQPGSVRRRHARAARLGQGGGKR